MIAQTKKQLEMFRKQCGGTLPITYFNVLEREDRVLTGEKALNYIENYTGHLPPTTALIPVEVFYIPESNFFLLPIPGEELTDDED